MLRFAVDACLPQPREIHTGDTIGRDVNDISNLLSGLSMSLTSRFPGSDHNPNDVRIEKGGSIVPQNALIELATRSMRYIHQFDWDSAYPQLFLSQTPNHYVAVHDKGTFTHIIQRSLGDPELEKIDADSQDGFRKLRCIFQVIQDLAKGHGERGRLSLVYWKGVMRVYQRTKNTCSLPDDIMERFE